MGKHQRRGVRGMEDQQRRGVRGMQFQNKLHKLAMSSKFNLMLVLLLTICTTRNTIIAYLINRFNLVLAYVGIICSLMLIASLLLRGNALKEQILQRLQNGEGNE